jgi:rRNA processing protein Krr1/Pno1
MIGLVKYIYGVSPITTNHRSQHHEKPRIYRVTELATNKVRIIEATSVAHAMKHVAETTHKCEVANGVEAVKLIAEGVKFESAVKVPSV